MTALDMLLFEIERKPMNITEIEEIYFSNNYSDEEKEVIKEHIHKYCSISDAIKLYDMLQN